MLRHPTYFESSRNPVSVNLGSMMQARTNSTKSERGCSQAPINMIPGTSAHRLFLVPDSEKACHAALMAPLHCLSGLGHFSCMRGKLGKSSRAAFRHG